jgi:hypothetical protein
MKKTLLTTATAVATVMSASAAYADLSLGGALARSIQSGDGTKGLSNSSTSSTITVNYTTTLDNGMGMAANTVILPNAITASNTGSAGAVRYLLTVSSDLGSFYLGSQMGSAMDDMDGTQGAGSYNGGGRILSAAAEGYSDGDTATGNGFGISTNLAGAAVKVTMGDNSAAGQDDERALSMAASYNLMGATIKAGNTDYGTDAKDDSFYSIGYSVGGFDLGWNMFDSGTTEMVQIGASTTVAGLSVGVSSAETSELAGTADQDAMGIHVGGSLGGAFWNVDYINSDDGAGTEVDKYRITFGVGF